jgi:hypothetical protein
VLRARREKALDGEVDRIARQDRDQGSPERSLNDPLSREDSPAIAFGKNTAFSF